MITERLMTQSYVTTGEGTEYKLEYYIFSKPSKHRSIYGITIKKHIFSIIESKTELVSENEADVLSLINCYAKNFVFPSSLCDLMYDLEKSSALTLQSESDI